MKLSLVTTSPVGGWTKRKLMLISTQVEAVIEVRDEPGKIIYQMFHTLDQTIQQQQQQTSTQQQQ